mmetsp:Transcript_42047/g.48758  ORF Transcript_42047/g.48758 Transcript_42047/m.48758 type:complete len:157 (-) Transcript_42047:46-516(-)
MTKTIKSLLSAESEIEQEVKTVQLHAPSMHGDRMTFMPDKKAIEQEILKEELEIRRKRQKEQRQTVKIGSLIDPTTANIKPIDRIKRLEEIKSNQKKQILNKELVVDFDDEIFGDSVNPQKDESINDVSQEEVKNIDESELPMHEMEDSVEEQVEF